MLVQLVEKYPDDVQIIYRHFPLNRIHAHAQKAAEAAEAAGAQGAFWEYHTQLYARQQQWAGLDEAGATSFFVDLAAEFNLDADQFATELEEDTYTAYVAGLEQESINLQLAGTPSAIFNGELFSGDSMPPMAFWIWDAFVQLELLADRQYDAPPELSIDTDSTYLATVEMESGNSFTIELYPQSAPETVNSFIFLANEGWFDDVTFHRVLPGFVAQTGDPTGSGVGGPGYTIPTEIDPDLSHSEAGLVVLANAGPHQIGSQP